MSIYLYGYMYGFLIHNVPASARAVRRPLKADVRCSFSFIPCFRIVGLQQIPKLFTNFRLFHHGNLQKSQLHSILEDSNSVHPLHHIDMSKNLVLWINDPKTIRVIKNGIIAIWFRFGLCKHSICIGFNSEHFINTVYREG